MFMYKRGNMFIGSKPTVWDGDPLKFFLYINLDSVLSPPCGMATGLKLLSTFAIAQVLSPPCGMATIEELTFS